MNAVVSDNNWLYLKSYRFVSLQQERSSSTGSDGSSFRWITSAGCGKQTFLSKLITRKPSMDRTRPIATPSCPGLKISRQSTSTLKIMEPVSEKTVLNIYYDIKEVIS